MGEDHPWYFDGRYYGLTVAGAGPDVDGLTLELEDLAPAPGRGLVLTVIRDDDRGGRLDVRAETTDALPLELVEQLLVAAREHLTERPADSEV